MVDALSLGSLALDAVLDGPPQIESGERCKLLVTVRNSGTEPAPESSFALSASPAILLVTTSPHRRPVGRRTIAPHAGRDLHFAIPSLLAGESLEIQLDVYALSADPHGSIALRGGDATIEREVGLRIVALPAFAPGANRLELDASEGQAGDAIAGRLVVTNTGSAPADPCTILIDGDLEDLTLEAHASGLGPLDRRIVRFTGRIPAQSKDGAVLRVVAAAVVGEETHRLGEAHVVARGRPRFEGRIEAGVRTGSAGETIAWKLALQNAGDAAAREVRIAVACAGAVYLPGSTTIGGVSLLDVRGTSPLWSSEGLTLEAVPPGCPIDVVCATLLEPGAEQAMLWARVLCGESESLIESPAVRIEARSDRAPAFPFVVRGVAFRCAETPHSLPVAAIAPAESLPVRSGETRSVPLDAATVRHLGQLPGLMRHLWALGVLCADKGRDERHDAGLAELRVALRSVFDRLSIKLRMPQYRVGPEDVLDPAAWDALAAVGIEFARERDPFRVLGDGLDGILDSIAPAHGDALAGAALESYREVFARELRGRDDAAILAALTAEQPPLDEALDAVLACEANAVLA